MDFSRSMNRITFDKIISSKPEKYPFVSLPQEEEEVVPDRGLHIDLRAGHSLRVVSNFPSKNNRVGEMHTLRESWRTQIFGSVIACPLSHARARVFVCLQSTVGKKPNLVPRAVLYRREGGQRKALGTRFKKP